jgi:hypothetical protein
MYSNVKKIVEINIIDCVSKEKNKIFIKDNVFVGTNRPGVCVCCL